MKMKQNRLCMLAVCSLLLSHKSGAVTFDTSLLAGASGESDLSRFYENNAMPAGPQEMDIYVNGDWKGRYTVTYGEQQDDVRLAWKDALMLGINTKAIPAPAITDGQVQLHDLVQGGEVKTDTSTLSLALSVPQAAVLRTEEGYVVPQFWDEGIPALMLSWNTTWYNTRTKGSAKETNDDFYAGLDSGANLLGWQFRDSSTWRKSASGDSSWQNNTRYLRRPLAALKSNLTLGDFYIPGDLFDSLRVRGVSLASDMKMRPNSQQGFSPVVHGVARTNALVKVMQNGNVIYQENVPPGQFTLDSIQPTGSAGDLLVVVREADGSQQSFTVPFSAVPGMLKEGVSEYSVVAGKVHQNTLEADPAFLQATLRYGFNNLMTGYTGTIVSDNYQAGLIGTGWNLPFGAVSVDVTHAKTTLQDRTDSGQSFRVSYSKFIDTTATNFTLAAYRYSTKGYYSFSDALYSREGYQRLKAQYDEYEDRFGVAPEMTMSTWDALRAAQPKNTFTLNLNQRLPDNWGTVFISGTQRDYWNSRQTSREYQAGYSNAIGRASYTVSASRVRNSEREEETRFYLSLSLPFSLFDNNAWVTSSLTASDSHYEQSNISMSGNALASNRLSYTLSGSNARGGNNTASVNTAYRANFATLGGSYSESSDYRQTGLNGRGSLVAVPWHLLASNETGSTMTIVDAPQAEGLMVNGDESIVTNRDGVALVPYATPYRKNAITLSETANSRGAEVLGNIANVAPYDGAVNYIRFDTDQRQSWMLRATRPDGAPLPFGTEVLNERGESVGYVGQASVLYIRAEQPPRELSVHLRGGNCTIAAPAWGLESPSSVCHY
ncbi:fimbrial biogenesis outer membrane usher protein [Enterobacter cloacae]|uniref:fimbria/pilus outer membrane usher protein n=1 Tax=Enterobacter cloacae TaxID=550 RepID=UPI00200695BE|nr:fimbria/pilus outer membrane usher protein [Enterobacter cloacae]MCK6712065.1 fimbrial biogenesis outer membrane usher protein [Enterobacter cloacae]